MQTPSSACPRCQSPIPVDAPGGLCPACVLLGVAEPTDAAQAAAAQQLRISEGAVKVAIHRLRQRFREAVKAEIAQTVPTPSDVDDELRHLLAVLLAS